MRKDIYLTLYNEYKKIIANKAVNKWENYSMLVQNDIATKINLFVGSEK